MKYKKLKIERYKEIESTHKYIKENYKKYDENIVIIADKQTGGIGTKGRNWYTGTNKNIAISILYKPKCQVNKLEGLTIKIAEKIKKVIYNEYKIDLQIKEPNDLILNNKKICGILTEINTLGNEINYLIISMGFNVNETEFPKEVENIATSLKKEYSIDFDKEALIEKIIKELENII